MYYTRYYTYFNTPGIIRILLLCLSGIPGPFLTKKKITIRDLFVVNRVFFCHDLRHDFFLLFPNKIKSRFETFCRGSIYAISRQYVTHTSPTVSEGRYRGMADSASYADCRERATPQGSRGAWANEHVVAASKPRGGDTARKNSENTVRISRARPGRRPVRLETRWPGRADVAWD